MWTVPWPGDARHRGGITPSAPRWEPPCSFHLPPWRHGIFQGTSPPLLQGERRPGRSGQAPTPRAPSPFWAQAHCHIAGGCRDRWEMDGHTDKLQERLAGSLRKPRVHWCFPRGGLGRRSHSSGWSSSLETTRSVLSRPPRIRQQHLPWGFLRARAQPSAPHQDQRWGVGLVATQALRPNPT